MNAGAKQRLADIDVAETGDDALVKEKQFDGGTAARKPALQIRGCNLERFRTERLEGGPILEFGGW
jgi:hypothetical protein